MPRGPPENLEGRSPVKDKRGGVADIPSLENQAETKNGSTLAEKRASFQNQYTAFQIAQANISAAIFPVLNEITDGSNSTLVYNLAWSIWAELIASTDYVSGPCSHGLHAFDAIEDEYAKANHLSEDDPQMMRFLAVTAVLADLYEYGWAESVKAANKTGLLADFAILTRNLAVEDPSVPPAGFWTTVSGAPDDAYFVQRNRTKVSTQAWPVNGNGTVGNGTAGKGKATPRL